VTSEFLSGVFPLHAVILLSLIKRVKPVFLLVFSKETFIIRVSCDPSGIH